MTVSGLQPDQTTKHIRSNPEHSPNPPIHDSLGFGGVEGGDGGEEECFPGGDGGEGSCGCGGVEVDGGDCSGGGECGLGEGE